MDEAEMLGYEFSRASTNNGIQEGLDSLTAMMEAGEAEVGGEREEEEVEEELMYCWDEACGDEDQNF